MDGVVLDHLRTAFAPIPLRLLGTPRFVGSVLVIAPCFVGFQLTKVNAGVAAL